MSTATDNTPVSKAVVVGLGKTGVAVVRHLLARGLYVSATDTRVEPPGRALLAAADVAQAAATGRLTVHTGGLDASLLQGAGLVVLSPGLVPVGAFFDSARARGLPLVGDIELFAREAAAPVAGITGTNGKSTVTTLLGEMARRAGRAVRVGGNLGPPALDLLGHGADLYVLELSSFQLESTQSLRLAAAAVLNVTPDHLDRYADIDAYAAAKARIFRHCERAIINLDDARVAAMPPAGQPRLTFSVRPERAADYGVRERDGQRWLVAHGELLLPLGQLKITGLHNAANALAALALAEALALPREACLAALREFAGLAHRMQCVAEINGVRYIDDSKGTNVGATLAAVAGLRAANGARAGSSGALLVIAGGDGKQQDFAPLRAAFDGVVRCALLIGRDARTLGEALGCVCECHYCASLEVAVARAAALARPGEIVLLSPACASLDMFRDYAHRGEVFAAAVRRLVA